MLISLLLLTKTKKDGKKLYSLVIFHFFNERHRHAVCQNREKRDALDHHCLDSPLLHHWLFYRSSIANFAWFRACIVPIANLLPDHQETT